MLGVNPLENLPSSTAQPPMPNVSGLVENETKPFQLILDDAMGTQSFPKPVNAMPIQPQVLSPMTLSRGGEVIAQALGAQDVESLNQRRRQNTQIPAGAQAVGSGRLSVTPFQFYIDKSVEALKGVSNMEYRVNNLIGQYIQGNVSVDRVSIETAKLNLAISFITTVVTTATQTFKELTGMQI